MRDCMECGEPFEPTHGLQKLCSDECKAARNRKLHRARSKAYVRRHPERRKATLDGWWRLLRADPVRYARFLAQGRASYARHPDTGYLYAMWWRATNRERVRELVARAHAKRDPIIRQANRAAVREYIALIKGDPCVYCGSPSTTVDHIVPLALGGMHEPDNLAPACHSCNCRKRTRPLLRFLLARPELAVA